jgi:hypothetical protein
MTLASLLLSHSIGDHLGARAANCPKCNETKFLRFLRNTSYGGRDYGPTLPRDKAFVDVKWAQAFISAGRAVEVPIAFKPERPATRPAARLAARPAAHLIRPRLMGSAHILNSLGRSRRASGAIAKHYHLDQQIQRRFDLSMPQILDRFEIDIETSLLRHE